jgi:hypothetical protein
MRTSRPLLELVSPLMRIFESQRFGKNTSHLQEGMWSQDGNEFWTHFDSQGKLSGWDFRPREEPKK